MRCTKCSFISFDDLSACAKCSSDLSHLSKELNGTCVETRQEFFLGSAIQATGLSEGDFSDSQTLPPLDHSDVNFDDTNASRFPSMAASSADVSDLGFDDSLSFAAEDDVSIELGDIMPLDLEQLDSLSLSSDSALEPTDALTIDNLSFGVDKVSTVVDQNDSGIDLDLTDDFDDSDSKIKLNDDLDIDLDNSPFAYGDDSANATTSLFEKTFADLPAEQYEGSDIELDRELFQQFSDNGGLDETISLDVDAGLEQTGFSHILTGDDSPAPLELDESLVAELAGTSALDASGEFSVDFSADHAASGEFVLDEALVAELAIDENVAIDRSGYQLDYADHLSANQSAVSGVVEDLTGDFPPIREDDDVELSGLDLADIDVSDLIENSGVVSSADAPGESVLSVEDTIRDASASRQQEQELGFDEISMGEGLSGFDDLRVGEGGGDLAANDIDFSPGDASSSLEPIALSLNDTLQDGDEAAALLHPDEEDVSGDDISLTELSLDYDGGIEDLSLGVDTLAFDDELESFLVKEGAAEKIPGLELIADDDEDGPPDLPR